MVKPWVTEMAAAVTQECITPHDGAGYAIETRMDGLHRDAPQSVPSDLFTTR